MTTINDTIEKEIEKFKEQFPDGGDGFGADYEGMHNFLRSFAYTLLSSRDKAWVTKASNTIAQQMIDYANTPLKKRRNAYKELYEARIRIEALTRTKEEK